MKQLYGSNSNARNNKLTNQKTDNKRPIYKRPAYGYEPTKTDLTYMYDSDYSEKD